MPHHNTIHGKTSMEAVFMPFHSIMNLFLQIMTFSISSIRLEQCYNESFTTNSHFPLKTQKFSLRLFFIYGTSYLNPDTHIHTIV